MKQTTEECLVISDKQLLHIREAYNLNDIAIERDVTVIAIWYKQQPHLPQEYKIDRGWIERLLIMNKCSLERTKERIDLIFASKNLIPEFFACVDPDGLMSASTALQCFPLPKLNVDFNRVMVMRPIGQHINKFDTTQCAKYFFMIMLYRMHHDYCLGDTIILDLNMLNIAIFTKINPSVLRKASLATRKVLGARIKAVHIINASNSVENVLFFARACLSSKIQGRIAVHATLEDLYKHVDQDILPNDLGGKTSNYNDLNDNWNKLLCQKKNAKWFKEQSNLKSNEKYRPGKQLQDDLFGVTGSFRSLNID